jgi:VIT1/CCC1 family predicted Fe2+/Mn2+ transporter
MPSSPRDPAAAPAGADTAQGRELARRLNWLRAGVMGANDGIVSTAGLVAGVAGAAGSHQVLLLSGAAALVAGAMSMAAGEYVSVWSQRDSERAEIENERRELAADPVHGLRQLTGLIEAQGIDQALARQVAEQLTRHDALTAHARLELSIDPKALANPWSAAFASMISFVIGGIVPFLAIVLSPRDLAVPITTLAVTIALAATGALSAYLGRAPLARAALRTVLGGILAMAVTYGVGALIRTPVSP